MDEETLNAIKKNIAAYVEGNEQNQTIWEGLLHKTAFFDF